MQLSKRVFCFLLAILMLGSLCALAAGDAPEEAAAIEEAILDEPAEEPIGEPEPIEEPVETPIEAPAEEPIGEPEPVIEEPAADGAVVKASGKLNANQFSNNAELELTGDTELIINADKTIERIFGNYALTITVESGKTMKINNTNGHAIQVRTLTVNGPGTLELTASKNGIYTDGNITLGGRIIIKAGAGAIRSVNGEIISSAQLTATCTGSNESYDNYVIRAYGVISLRSDNGAYVKVTGDLGGIRSDNANIGVYSDTEVISDYNAAYRADNGGVVFFSGTHTARGNDKGTMVYGMTSGISADYVTVLDTAKLTASGSLVGINAAGGVKLNGPTTATAKDKSGAYTSTTIGVSAKTITIGAAVSASANSYAFKASDSITIDTGYYVTSPSNGKVAKVTENYSTFHTVTNSGGKAVSSASIGRLSPISSVAVTDFVKPSVGKTGDTSVIVDYGKNYTLESVNWYDMTTDPGSPLTGSWTFQTGHTYKCIIILEAKAGYTFTEGLTASLNGASTKGCGLLGGDGTTSTMAWIEYTETITNTVTVTMDANGGKFLLELAAFDPSIYFDGEAEEPAVDGLDPLTMEPITGITYEPIGTGTFVPADPLTLAGTTTIQKAVTVGEAYGPLREPTRSGYIFQGWYTDDVGGTKVTASTICTKTSDHTLYAHWKEEPAPTFNIPVVMGGLTEPKAGETIKANAASGSTSYKIKNQGWYDSILSTGPTEDTTFQSGKLYYWIASVELTDGYVFADPYTGTLTLNGKTVKNMSTEELTNALANEEPVSFYFTGGNVMTICVSYKAGGTAPSGPSGPLTLTFATDGKSAKVTGDWAGKYARVALVLDNGGVSGLYITQATINDDGTILVPKFEVPGLKVRGVNIAIVPTLADIQSTTPSVIVMASKMFT